MVYSSLTGLSESQWAIDDYLDASPYLAVNLEFPFRSSLDPFLCEQYEPTIQPSLLCGSPREQPYYNQTLFSLTSLHHPLSSFDLDSDISSAATSHSGSSYSTPSTGSSAPVSLPYVPGAADYHVPEGDVDAPYPLIRPPTPLLAPEYSYDQEPEAADTEADADSEYHFDGCDSDDDEYVPAKESSNRRKRGRCPPTKGYTEPKASSSRPIKPLPSSSRPVKKARRGYSQDSPGTFYAGSSANRLDQATGAMAELITRAAYNPGYDGLDFKCPMCLHETLTKRLPDFKRHLKTHIRPDEHDETRGWRCPGMRLKDFKLLPPEVQNDLRARCDPEQLTPYQFAGEEYIGGCRKSFSRRDALTRHLKDTKLGCMSSRLQVSRR